MTINSAVTLRTTRWVFVYQLW